MERMPREINHGLEIILSGRFLYYIIPVVISIKNRLYNLKRVFNVNIFNPDPVASPVADHIIFFLIYMYAVRRVSPARAAQVNRGMRFNIQFQVKIRKLIGDHPHAKPHIFLLSQTAYILKIPKNSLTQL